jgi:hypothetical protein
MEPHEAPLSLCSSVHGLPPQHNAWSRPATRPISTASRGASFSFSRGDLSI